MDLLIQKQIRDNAETMRDYQKSLDNWEKEIRLKDEELLKVGKEETKDIVEKKDKLTPEHKEADLYKQKGNELVRFGKWKEALKEYTTSISLYSEDAVYYGNRSYCYLRLNQLKEAELDCNMALELKPDYVKVFLRRANIRRQLGNFVGAAKDYNLILCLEPKNTTAIKEYKSIYEDVKKHYLELDIKLPDFHEMNFSLNTTGVENDIDLNLKKTLKFNKIIRKNEPDKLVIPSEIKRSKIDSFTNYEIIFPKKDKAPHLRSKLPLKRISIEDVYLNSEDDSIIEI